MSQHFLLSAKARSLSLAKVARLSDEEAYQTFKLVRWAATDGAPVCPRCGCVAVYTYATRKLFKCKACNHQFSVTSGTIFASRKLSIRDYLLAIAIFVNGAKGHSALQLSRDLDCQYKTAFVIAHKIREALASEAKGATVSGEVEVDGAYFGGHVRPANRKVDRKDRRLAENQTGKRRVVVIIRERGGVQVGRCLSRHDCPHRCARQHCLCRRSNALGRATCALPDEKDQSQRKLFGRSGLHQPSGVVFLPPAPR